MDKNGGSRENLGSNIYFILSEREVQAQTKNLVYAES